MVDRCKSKRFCWLLKASKKIPDEASTCVRVVVGGQAKATVDAPARTDQTAIIRSSGASLQPHDQQIHPAKSPATPPITSKTHCTFPHTDDGLVSLAVRAAGVRERRPVGRRAARALAAPTVQPIRAATCSPVSIVATGHDGRPFESQLPHQDRPRHNDAGLPLPGRHHRGHRFSRHGGQLDR
jgi:hypothetical protein